MIDVDSVTEQERLVEVCPGLLIRLTDQEIILGAVQYMPNAADGSIQEKLYATPNEIRVSIHSMRKLKVSETQFNVMKAKAQRIAELRKDKWIEYSSTSRPPLEFF